MLRVYLGVSMSAPCAGMTAEMRIMNPQSYAWINMISYWLRVKCMPESRITKRVLNWDLYVQENNPSFKTYSSNIFSILNTHGLLHYYTSYIKPKTLTKLLSEVLYKKDMNDCQLACLNSSQLITYNQINNFDTEKIHLMIPLNFRFKSVLSKFRMSTLPIRIVTGRWERPKLKRNERYCLQCNEYRNYDTNYIRYNIDELYDLNARPKHILH